MILAKLKWNTPLYKVDEFVTKFSKKYNNNYGDYLSTVSLGQITESIYILDKFFLFVPILLGFIFSYYNYIVKNVNKEFYLSFSLLFILLIISKESFSAISLDIIMIFILTILTKKYFVKYC